MSRGQPQRESAFFAILWASIHWFSTRYDTKRLRHGPSFSSFPGLSFEWDTESQSARSILYGAESVLACAPKRKILVGARCGDVNLECMYSVQWGALAYANLDQLDSYFSFFFSSAPAIILLYIYTNAWIQWMHCLIDVLCTCSLYRVCTHTTCIIFFYVTSKHSQPPFAIFLFL